MKKLMIFMAVMVFAVVGCEPIEGDDITVQTQKTEAESVQSDGCNPVDLEKIKCTVGMDDDLPDYDASMVASRLYNKAQAALDECYSYADVVYAYEEAMMSLNSMEKAPEEVEYWFNNYMLYAVGYDG